jgi:restriction system protein
MEQLRAAEEVYDKEAAAVRARIAAQHAEVDAVKAELERNTREAVKDYFEMVLGRSSWPDGFPQQFVLAYDADSKLLAIDYMLPDWSVVPEAKTYKFVKARDAMEPVPESSWRSMPTWRHG